MRTRVTTAVVGALAAALLGAATAPALAAPAPVGTAAAYRCHLAPNVTVSYGSSDHSAVKCAQYMLAFGGFYHGALDGLFGPQTLAAVKEFQRRNGLVVDGIVGPRTWGELERMVTW